MNANDFYASEYKVLNARNLISLETIVTLEMQKGFKPQGGVHRQEMGYETMETIWKIGEDGEIKEFGRAMSNSNWCQAMIR